MTLMIVCSVCDDLQLVKRKCSAIIYESVLPIAVWSCCTEAISLAADIEEKVWR